MTTVGRNCRSQSKGAGRWKVAGKHAKVYLRSATAWYRNKLASSERKRELTTRPTRQHPRLRLPNWPRRRLDSKALLLRLGAFPFALSVRTRSGELRPIRRRRFRTGASSGRRACWVAAASRKRGRSSASRPRRSPLVLEPTLRCLLQSFAYLAGPARAGVRKTLAISKLTSCKPRTARFCLDDRRQTETVWRITEAVGISRSLCGVVVQSTATVQLASLFPERTKRRGPRGGAQLQSALWA